jgi:hypothetical protein
MDYASLRSILAVNAGIIQKLTEDVSMEQAQWKPDADRWSILEVINHLYDEEREDFRLHLDIMLHRPESPWPPIDPMNWVTTRKYNERSLRNSIENFVCERQQSLSWLDSLSNPDWDKAVQAPWGFPIRSGDMFASWVIHDQWHIQQIVRLRRDWSANLAMPYSVEYAGSL